MRKSASNQGRVAPGLSNDVRAWTEVVTFPTYLPAAPDRNPMFLEKRVYQGSSGKVYPLPFTDRIAEKPVDREWKAVWLENEYLKVMILPEIGGRIHRLLDKTNHCDVIYYQPVIKPALVGLAGPWISGGIEFNWPQHHRPATFLPVDFEIEEHADGSETVWCSDHDPLQRMKGMHGICLHPGRAYLELKVRAHNRTPFTQTFLWWANVATVVHEAYQSFFPPDVHHVADHARRSMTEYPLAQGHYYGVNYGERGRKGVPQREVSSQFVPPHCGGKSEVRSPKSEIPGYRPNDLSFYANIPVPTSYMCMGSKEDFFGGYDYQAQAGIVHLANHHLSPGKKQWTWGNHEFGYAWDRNLTDPDEQGVCRPYIEIMAGVYTDNQPDFTFLQPGETKAWSQYWYPIRKIGPAQHANLDAAVSLRRRGAQSAPVSIGVSVTRAIHQARITVSRKSAPTDVGGSRAFADFTCDLAPDRPFVREVKLPKGVQNTDLLLRVTDREGHELIAYQPKPPATGKVTPPATEPPSPGEIPSNDELFITGLHLDQYRHATRCPTLYWREALRRDPLDARCNNALGLWHLKRGEFVEAEQHFRNAIQRLTRRNANPYDGEPLYHLGLTLRNLGRDEEVYDAFYKACWNQAWMAAGYHALAEIDCCRRDWATALDHLKRSLRFNTDNLRARNLRVIALRELATVAQASRLPSDAGKTLALASEADRLLQETLEQDPLDWWARHLRGDNLTCDLQTQLDLAHDYARAGFLTEAVKLLESSVAQPSKSAVSPGSQPARRSHLARPANLEIGDTAGWETCAAGDLPDQSWGALPMVHYTLGWLEQKLGNGKAALKHFRRAAAESPDYCFPARLEEIAILQAAMAIQPHDARAPYYLGNLLYDRRRHEEAIRLWERAAKLDPTASVVWRNLGIGYCNIRRQPAKARAAYERAFRTRPADARVLYERDQLWKRLGEQPEKRLRELQAHLDLVRQRDDLSVEFCALLNQTGRHAEALDLVSSRHFQPWEGGEGGPLGQWVRSHVMLGRDALGKFEVRSAKSEVQRELLNAAVAHFEAALTAPPNLGEAKHLLANQSDIHYWLGCALAKSGDKAGARKHWRAAATFKGDFQEMSVRAFSEMTYYSALSWEKLGRRAKAQQLLRALLAHAGRLEQMEAKIDYFATSLPTLLLFEDDLQLRQKTAARFLQAQAHLGLGQPAKAAVLFRSVLRNDPSHALARDLSGRTRHRLRGARRVPGDGVPRGRLMNANGQHGGKSHATVKLPARNGHQWMHRSKDISSAGARDLVRPLAASQQ